MVRGLSENNHVPSSAWSKYEDTGLNEYRKFFQNMEQKKAESETLAGRNRTF